ncbi:MAG: Divalent-cation tolerance protein CutA [Chlamydiales bacterium]|nr:Divalent-cation tolerance protein CutA [Chlamydiales bacterium]MCH9635386.1 Divalent-cation tolerance protein CutA [Chlamydiales bacterium]MCH9704344.1 divalent-cation tolerance protein CutA [Chlamydiota bacterium]
MSEFIQIHWTCGGLDEARQIARELVEMRLVACASVVPWVESIFLWNDQLDTCQESKVIFKTRKELFEKVKEEILSRAKYEVPEILALPIVDGHKEYLEWVDSATAVTALD